MTRGGKFLVSTKQCSTNRSNNSNSIFKHVVNYVGSIDRWSKVSPWPQVLEDIPWIQVFKACMEKKLQESNFSGLCGTEVYVIVDSTRLEKLHNDPWWKHSRKLHSYLSNFEEKAREYGDVMNRNDVTDPPLKKRCLDGGLDTQSFPNMEEISQIMEDHQQSLIFKYDDDDLMDQGEESVEPKMSRLEMMIDSLQCRLGLGHYSAVRVEPEPIKNVETSKPADPLPLKTVPTNAEFKVQKEPKIVGKQEQSSESSKDKMKRILEAARKIVAPLQLAPSKSKHRELVQDYMLGRGKQDLLAARIPLSALNKSNFVERSNEEVEERIQLYKRPLTPEEENEEPEPYQDESSNSRSDSPSRSQRSSRSSDRSSVSEDSLDSVEAYSVTSGEKLDYNTDDCNSASPEYDNSGSPDYDKSEDVQQGSGDVAVEEILFSDEEAGLEREEEIMVEESNVAPEVVRFSSDAWEETDLVREEIEFGEEEYAEGEEEFAEEEREFVDDDSDVAVEVIRSSSDAREDDDMAGEEDKDGEFALEVILSSSDAREDDQVTEGFDEEEMEDEGNYEEDEDCEEVSVARRELSESDIKITDDEDEGEEEENARDISEVDIRSSNDDDIENVNENLDGGTDEEESEEGDDNSEEGNDSSDVQAISSDE